MTATSPALSGIADTGPAAACSHCLLPAGRLAQRRSVNGEDRVFCCYGCCIAYQVRHGVTEEHEAAWLLVRLGVGTFLAMNIMLFSLLLYSGSLAPGDGDIRQAVHVILAVFATVVVVILGEPFLRGAWQAAQQGRMSADSLVSLGALGAYGYSVYAVASGAEAVYFDTVTMVLVLFTLGRYLEALGRGRALRSLAPLLEAEEAEARVVADGAEVLRPVRRIAPGTVVRVHPGERIPVDGVVMEGISECDESVLTGQAEPQVKAVGAPVCAGAMNGTGLLVIRTARAGPATAWAGHARFVREALARRSLVSELTDRAATVFVPGVVLLAGSTVLYWSARAPFPEAAMTGLSVLVVACPCALGLAAPIATALGLGRAMERGILLRGGGVLERLGRLRAVAFDKTGTLTAGELRFSECKPSGVSEAELLRHAAGLAEGSGHPVGRAVLAAAKARELAPVTVRNLRAYPGEGLCGDSAAGQVALGSTALMMRLGWPQPALAEDDRTFAFVGWGGAVRGALLFEAPLLVEAATVAGQLRQRGIELALLSGDRPAAVRRAAAAVGIDTWLGDLDPMGKVDFLEAWSRTHGPVAMVGDGLNDGPVLAAAAVGIAVGDASDLAQESAEARLPTGCLASLPWLIDHARHVRRKVLSNILWAFGYNTIALTLAASGMLQPILAAALMAGSSLAVVANSQLAERRSRQAAEGV